MNLCDIIAIKHGRTFRWKWRHVEPSGQVKQSRETYDLYYDCVSAARKNGYQPKNKCL
jgi:hypothetical protein